MRNNMPIPASDPNYAHRRTNHEVAHCVVAVGLGIKVRDMSVIPNEDAVRFEPVGADRLHLLLLALIAGPIGEQDPISWPPDEKSKNDDERLAAEIARLCKIDYGGWLEANAIVRDFLKEADTRRAARELSFELRLHHGRLTGSQIYAATRGYLWEEAG
jgi:hypothetical protein